MTLAQVAGILFSLYFTFHLRSLAKRNFLTDVTQTDSWANTQVRPYTQYYCGLLGEHTGSPLHQYHA